MNTADLRITNNFHFKNKTNDKITEDFILAISMLITVLAENRSIKRMLERKCVFFATQIPYLKG